MKWFFVTPFTINVLNISLLVVFMVYFLSRNKNKSKATLFLIIFLSGVLLVFVSFVLIFSSLKPFYSTIAWWVIHLMVFASVAMVQFAYYFPKNIHPAESKIIFIVTLIASVGIYPYYIYRTLSMHPTYSFEGSLYAYFNTPEIGIIIGSEIIWVVILLLRKSFIFSESQNTLHMDDNGALESNHSIEGLKRIYSGLYHIIIKILSVKGKEAKALRNLALIFVSPVVLIFVIILAYVGYMSWGVVANILGTAFIVAVFLFVVLYINNASEPSTFMIKLVGISLGGILIALGIASNIALNIKEEAYSTKKLIDVEQLKNNIITQRPLVFPNDLSYILSWPERSEQLKKEPLIVVVNKTEITLNDLIRSKITEDTQKKIESSSISNGYRVFDPLDPKSFYITYLFDVQGKTYEMAYSYINYRKYIHNTGLKLVCIILGSFLFVILITPFIFKESIVKPLNLLLEGVRQVNKGELSVSVPVGVEDEIGYLSRSFNSMVESIRNGEKKLRDSLDYQVRLTDSYSCFVPKEFLNFLKKESIIDIKLGDNVQEEMTILFSDIRSFTMLSEKMSPQENFNFLNSCLQRLGPVVRKNNGFIDKYIGDAVMALFPRHPDDAVKAAIDMQRAVADYNIERAKNDLVPVEIGIGMHTGTLMLGTIGEEKRMEGTVISDTVNLASRVESLTKLYGAPIIASDVTINSLTEAVDFKQRYLDRVKVKGKNKWVDIYEIIDIESNNESSLKLKTKDKFEKGIRMYQTKDIQNALDCFKLILEISQKDKAARLYHTRCSHFHKNGIPDEWDGVSALGEK